MPSLLKINVYEHVFPVFGGVSPDGRELQPREVYGTAFPIGGNFWMTAGHVLRSAASYPVMAIGFQEGTGWWRARRCGPHETKDSHDIGIFQMTSGDPPIIPAMSLPWLKDELILMNPVLSLGYPYALNREIQSLWVRAFRGHVVGGGPTALFPARPRIYELDFQCPRGLSGAPLVFKAPHLSLAGIMINNTGTGMLVHSATEVLKEPSETKTVERWETLWLGVALQSCAVLPLRFDMLGGTLEEHLGRHGLLSTAGILGTSEAEESS